MLDEAVSTVMPLVTKNDNQLVTEFADDLGTVRVDLTKFRQSLFNLLSNAAKFTEKGTITLAGRTKCSEDDASGSMLSVSDTGIGISEDKLDAGLRGVLPGRRLDDPRLRRHRSRPAHQPAVLPDDGGDITVASEPGKGTHLHHRAADAGSTPWKRPRRPHRRSGEETGRSPLECRPILVVDDDPDSRELLQRMLESEGFDGRDRVLGRGRASSSPASSTRRS